MSSEASIEFFCAICGTGLSVEAASGGAFVECPACARVIPVPGELPRPAGGAYRPVYSPEVLSVEITFVCPACDRALIADARLVDAHFQCPRCGIEGNVPTWTALREDSGGADVPAVVLSADEMDFLSNEAALPIGPDATVRSTG